MEATVRLPNDRRSVRLARGFVGQALSCWSRERDHSAEELLTSELVTNAIVHAGCNVEVTVKVADERVCVEVHDDSDRGPARRRATRLATSGRGMELVEALSDDWGVRRIPNDGKVVWFVVDPHRTPR